MIFQPWLFYFAVIWPWILRAQGIYASLPAFCWWPLGTVMFLSSLVTSPCSFSCQVWLWLVPTQYPPNSGPEVPSLLPASSWGKQIPVGASYCDVLKPVNYQMHLTGSLVSFWVIILWMVLSGVASCLFWHWGRDNCFDLQTLIIAVAGSCLRGTCHLLHGLFPFLLPAGVFGAEGGSWQSFLESFRWIQGYFCLSSPATTPVFPVLAIIISCLDGWWIIAAFFWSAHLSVPTPHPFCFSIWHVFPPQTPFTGCPSGLKVTLLTKSQGPSGVPQESPPCSSIPDFP